jgi:DNA-binding response OmpR family regulator
VHILVATDADYVVNDVTSALSGPDVSFTIVREGREVSRVVTERTPDLAILDLQIGSKGGMAVAMDLRLDASAGNGPNVTVLMLLDRQADVHLARRSAADAWLVKPFDPLMLKRAVRDVLAGPAPEVAPAVVDETEATETAEEDAPVAG